MLIFCTKLTKKQKVDQRAAPSRIFPTLALHARISPPPPVLLDGSRGPDEKHTQLALRARRIPHIQGWFEGPSLMVRGAATKHTQLALRARQIPAAAKLGDYALGLRPRPKTPGYPSGTKCMCASALMREGKLGRVRVTTLSACGLDQIHPDTHRVWKTSVPLVWLCYEAVLQNIVAWLGQRFCGKSDALGDSTREERDSKRV